MEESRKRIIKISSIIQITTNICMLIFLGIALYGVVIAFFPYEEKDLPEILEKIVDTSSLLPIDVVNYFLGDSDLRLQIALSGLFIAVLGLIVIYCIYEYKKIFKSIIKEHTPFSQKTCEDFRKISFKVLPLLFYKTLVGVVVFLLLRLLAYIFEYGTYLQGKADETNRIQEEMIMSFAEITENKSEQTGKHVRRVAEYSRLIALNMGLDEEKSNLIRLASTMHDIGKLMIPDAILEKPSKLTDEEFSEIRKHPGYGEKLLKNVEGEVMRMAKTVAVEHHERPDGRGYPEGKTGDKLSVESQIVAVADVYDALTSKRSYKQAWDEKDAYNEIIKGKGTQFNETVVDAFIKAYPEINAVRERLQN